MPICTRCGLPKDASDFYKKADGHLPFCKDCHRKGLGAHLLENPERLSGKTFWVTWRKVVLAPIAKYFLAMANDAMERQMLEEIVREVDLELHAFTKSIQNKFNRIRHWRACKVTLNPDKMKAEECHAILGVPFPLSNGDRGARLRKAFREKARILHPDLHNGTEEEFKKVQEAYDFLITYYKERENGKHNKDTGDIPVEGRRNNG